MLPPRPPAASALTQAAPDLGAGEQAVQAWFAGCGRAAAPGRSFGAFPAAPAARRGTLGRRLAPLALVLLALVAGRSTGLGSSAGHSSAPRARGSGDPSVASLYVLDDPSVPMLHAVDTFDEVGILADAIGVAAVPGSGVGR